MVLRIEGQKFGRLLAVRPTELRQDKKIVWEFLCDCGKKHLTLARSVHQGHTRSCGCLSIDVLIERSTTHGLRHTREWQCWNEMMNRAKRYNKEHKSYRDRNITVCKRWWKFENFIKDMGFKPHPKMSLDRIDNDKGYSLRNCRWTTHKEQSNNRSNNVFLKIGDKIKTRSQWIETSDLSRWHIDKLGVRVGYQQQKKRRSW